MPPQVLRRLSLNAFLGWFVLLLCTELIGACFARNAAAGLDFRAFYAAGHIVRTDPVHLYDLATQDRVQSAFVSPTHEVIPFYHPAFEALFYLPLSFLNYRAAYLVYIGINTLLLGLAVLAAPFHSSFPLARRSHAAAFFLFLPALIAIFIGQDSVIFLLLCCLVLRELRKGDELAAGLLLGFGVFRPQLAVPLVALLAFRLGWRLLAGFIAVAAPLTLLCAVLVRRAGLDAMYSMLGKASMVKDHGALTQHVMLVYPQRMPNLYGLLYACAGRFMTPSRSFLMTAIASLVLFGCCAFVLRRSQSIASAFGIAVLGTALLSYHLYVYDVTVLLLPILLLSSRIHLYLVIVCYVLPYLLCFSGLGGWFSIFATVPLTLLCVAAFRVFTPRRKDSHRQLVSAPIIAAQRFTRHGGLDR